MHSCCDRQALLLLCILENLLWLGLGLGFFIHTMPDSRLLHSAVKRVQLLGNTRLLTSLLLRNTQGSLWGHHMVSLGSPWGVLGAGHPCKSLLACSSTQGRQSGKHSPQKNKAKAADLCIQQQQQQQEQEQGRRPQQEAHAFIIPRDDHQSPGTLCRNTVHCQARGQSASHTLSSCTQLASVQHTPFLVG